MAEETRKDGAAGAPDPKRGQGARDAIDRAADEERRSGRTGTGTGTGTGEGAQAGGRDLGGAAFPNPGGGGVLPPREGGAPEGAKDDPADDPARGHPDDGLGAGDALRGGGGSGPLPPGTGRPMPDPRPRGEAAREPGTGEPGVGEPGDDPGDDGSARVASDRLDAPEAPDAGRSGTTAGALDAGAASLRGAGRDADEGERARDRAAGASGAFAAPAAREGQGRVQVSAEERAFGRDAAGLVGGGSHAPRERPPGSEAGAAAGAASVFAADGPTAREADPSRAPVAGLGAQAMHAMGREAGRQGWVLWALGLSAIVAGAIALAMPLVASLAANAVVAAMLLASGTVGLVLSFRRREGAALAMGFALSALAAVTGLVMLLAPLAGIVALSTLIIAFFLASGLVRIWVGIRNPMLRGRGWLIASGALSIALAALLWSAFPGAALWLPGVLLAIDLILYGTMMIALAVFGRPKLDAERLG